MLNWAQQFDIFCFLDNHQYTIQPHSYECVLGAGTQSYINSNENLLSLLDKYITGIEWVFGHLSYDLKNNFFSPGNNSKEDKIGFPDFFFFEPLYIIFIEGKELIIEGKNPDEIYYQLSETSVDEKFLQSSLLTIEQRLTKEQYINKIRDLQYHIHRGDCYEINFCQEFFCENAVIDPIGIYQNLVQLSPTPFSVLYKLNDKYLLCASPERFLQKKANKLLSQPMKGTVKRSLKNKLIDKDLKIQLQKSAKEQAENVMVVDLVRNDLSKICKDGTVKVEELFGIYSYPQVHQMVSTVTGEIQDNINFSEIIEATFPMGSMTGAPKKRVLELIDEYETSKRGIFSGAVGYLHENDFDFNVVIRSIMYNETNGYLSYLVGSGITFYSDPEKEWEECLLKGEAIKKVLTESQHFKIY
ncbi:MAG TPA: anthranilate synthase component I family protein [Chitinophagaceae bacterium]|nr:anthranilate synthase component I family protein [Chitinophagaceae bacterium]